MYLFQPLQLINMILLSHIFPKFHSFKFLTHTLFYLPRVTSKNHTRIFSNLPDVSKMRIAQLKQELELYGFSTKSFIEKRELVDALKKARNSGLFPKNDVNHSYNNINDGVETVTAEVVTDDIPKKEETVKSSTNTVNSNGFMGGLGDLMKNMGNMGNMGDMIKNMSGLGDLMKNMGNMGNMG